jgi:hypothetical protein
MPNRTVTLTVVVTIMENYDTSDEEALQQVVDALTDAEIMAYVYPQEDN